MDFIEKLRQELLKPLPGKEVQLEMAAGNRVFYKEISQEKEPKEGSVLILLYQKNIEWHTVFIKRTRDNGPHSGQMAFPGGMLENEDNSLFETALREANEEIGVNRNDVKFVGKLTPLHIPVSNILVHPYIGELKHTLEFVLSPDEVEDILEVPLKIFFEEQILSHFIFEFRGNKYKAPSFIINEFTIWGATAMMWKEFLTIYKRVLDNEQK